MPEPNEIYALRMMVLVGDRNKLLHIPYIIESVENGLVTLCLFKKGLISLIAEYEVDSFEAKIEHFNDPKAFDLIKIDYEMACYLEKKLWHIYKEIESQIFGEKNIENIFK